MLFEGMLSVLADVCVEISDHCIVFVQVVAKNFMEYFLTCSNTCNKLDNAHHGTL